MRKISYKCKNCGGTINVDKNNTTLICKYCDTKYDNFVSIEETDLKKFTERLEINSYVCSCGNKYNHFNTNSKDGICPSCEKKNEVKESQIINSVVLKDFNSISIGEKYAESVANFSDFIPNEFLKLAFEFKYIKTEIYDGMIDINAILGDGTKINKKYVLFDIIVPDSEMFNYNDKLEIIKSKVDFYKIFNKKSSLTHLQIRDLEISFDKKNDLALIEEACVNDFKATYSNIVHISVNTSVDITYNNYFPIYFNSIMYEGREYHNFAIGCRMKGKTDVSFYYDLPEFTKEKEDLFVATCNKHRRFMINYFGISLFLSLLLLVSFFAFPSAGGIIFLVFSIVLFGSLSLTSKNKLELLKKCKVMFSSKKLIDKDEFYKELVNKNNSIIVHIDWS